MNKREVLLAGLAAAGLAVYPLVHADNGLLMYCGITMVRPVIELARLFEQQEHIRITVSQGGSEDLYQSLKLSRRGDLYLPGEPSYRDKHLPEGLLGQVRTVGYNQLSMFVQKGNPKNVRANLNELLRPDLVLILGNAQSGSVGQASKSLLDRFKLYPRAVSKAAFLLPDSRALTLSLKRGEADITLCWRATAFFPDNSPHMDVVDLSPAIASPQALLVNLLTFSNHTAAAGRFIDLMVSPQGQAVFRKHGFLDASLKS